MVAHTYNPSSQEAKTSVSQIPSQPRLYSKTLFQKIKQMYRTPITCQVPDVMLALQ